MCFVSTTVSLWHDGSQWFFYTCLTWCFALPPWFFTYLHWPWRWRCQNQMQCRRPRLESCAMSPDTEKICHLLAFVWILYESFLMKFLENLVSSLGFHQPKKKNKPFRCWIIGTARIRLAVSLALVYFHPYANCSRLLLVKLPKRGKVWGHGPIFFFGATSCLPSLPRLFPILYFFEPDCLYSSQKICNTDRSLPVVLVLDSSKHLVNVAAHSLMVTSWILWKITVSDKPTKGAMFPSYE